MITAAPTSIDSPSPSWHKSSRAFAALAVLLFASARGSAALDWAVGAEGGYFTMNNASRSAKAVFGGGSGGGTLGGFLEVGVGRSFFVSGHVRRFQRTGERVFVADTSSPVFRLGHPLTIREVPAYAMVGWRFLPNSRWTPYIALGAGVTSYHEESNVAGLVETASKSKASGHVALGVDFGLGSLRVGAEAMYSTVPNTIGESGVSKVYGEKDVGGASIVGKVSFGSRR
jgi:hypothetical protein